VPPINSPRFKPWAIYRGRVVRCKSSPLVPCGCGLFAATPHVLRIQIRVAGFDKTEMKLTWTEIELTRTETKLTQAEARLTWAETKLTQTETKLTQTETKLTLTEAKLT
jgi:hypothetical protein